MSNNHVIPQQIVTMLSYHFDGYSGYDFTDIVAPAEVWAEMWDILNSLDAEKIKPEALVLFLIFSISLKFVVKATKKHFS